MLIKKVIFLLHYGTCLRCLVHEELQFVYNQTNKVILIHCMCVEYEGEGGRERGRGGGREGEGEGGRERGRGGGRVGGREGERERGREGGRERERSTIGCGSHKAPSPFKNCPKSVCSSP